MNRAVVICFLIFSDRLTDSIAMNLKVSFLITLFINYNLGVATYFAFIDIYFSFLSFNAPVFCNYGPYVSRE